MTEPRERYGNRYMPASTAALYREYKQACRELSEYRARGEVHPLLLELRQPAKAPRAIWRPWTLSERLLAATVALLAMLAIIVGVAH